MQGAFREPRIEVDADSGEIVSEFGDDGPVTPLGGLLGADVVAELVPQGRGHVDQVRALVTVFRRRLAAVSGHQRGRERVELTSGVIQVVLAVHSCALGGQQVGDRVPDRHPPAAAGVQRPGRIGRNELQIDREVGVRIAVAVLGAAGDDRPQHVVEPGGSKEEVSAAG